MRLEAMFYVKRRQKGNVYRGFGGFCGAVRQKHAARFCGLGGFDCGRVFVVGRNMGGCGVCLKWYETFDARALSCSLRRGFIDEGVE